MSAIQSLLRVMTLRDAEAIVLEAGKVPSLRRRGQVEALAMPALEAKLLTEFAAPLVVDRSVDDWPASVPFQDPDGNRYQCTIDKVAAGLRIVVRPGKPVAQAPGASASAASVASSAATASSPGVSSAAGGSAADTKPRAWWAKPAPAPAAPAPPAAAHAPSEVAPPAPHAL
ncbi:MAG TPA: hypothetical protein VN253_29695, partial [Kofleriaceae bacterium]|nr:hypothetical protein [Kofleriaceae bacterium]